MKQRTDRNPERSPMPFWRTPPFVVFAILLLAVALRLYRICEQSMFWDEYSVYALAFNNATSMCAGYALWGPAHVPGYPTFIRLLKPLVGLEPIVLRLISVAASVSCVPLLYLLCRDLFDRRTAYWAAFLIAISPMQIWWGQALQTYAFTTPLALISTLLFLRLEQGRSRSIWTAYVLVNAAMVFMHYFTGFLLAAHGLYLLARHANDIRFLIQWGCTQIVAMAPALAWLAVYLPFMVDYGDYTYPALSQVMAFFVGHDVVRHTYEFGLYGTWSFLPEPLVRLFFSLESAANMSIMLLAAALIAYGLIVRGGEPSRHKARLLLMLVAFLPSLIVMVMTYAWQPVIAYRFVIFSSFAFYGLVAAGLAGIRHNGVRAIAASVLLVLYAYQASLIFPTYTRTPWGQAAQVVQERAQGSSATVFVKGQIMPMFAAQLLAFGQDSGVLSAHDRYTYYHLFETVVEESAETGNDTALWILVESSVQTDHDEARDGVLTRFLHELGMAFRVHTFQGMSRLDLYEIERTVLHERPVVQPIDDLTPMLEYLGLPLDSDELLRDVARIVDHPLDPKYIAAFYLAPHMVLDLGADELAEAMVRHALVLAPDYPPNYLNATLMEMRYGRTEAALENLAMLERFGSFNLRRLIAILRFTLEQRELDRRDALLELFENWNVFYRALTASIDEYESKLGESATLTEPAPGNAVHKN